MRTHGWIWNGNLRLEGELCLTPCYIFFDSKDFPESHINFKIDLKDIEFARSFMLFNIERKGLHVRTKDQRNEYFILEELRAFKKKLDAQRKIINKGKVNR